MSYVKNNWINNQTALSADNLNHIESGISAIDEKCDTISTKVTNVSEFVDEINDGLTAVEQNKLDKQISRTSTTDVSTIWKCTLATESGTKTLEISPIVNGSGNVEGVEIGGTIPVKFGENVVVSSSGGGIDEYSEVITAVSYPEYNTVYINDYYFDAFLNGTSHNIIKFTINCEFFGDSSSERTFILTKQAGNYTGLYVDAGGYTVYAIVLTTGMRLSYTTIYR